MFYLVLFNLFLVSQARQAQPGSECATQGETQTHQFDNGACEQVCGTDSKWGVCQTSMCNKGYRKSTSTGPPCVPCEIGMYKDRTDTSPCLPCSNAPATRGRYINQAEDSEECAYECEGGIKVLWCYTVLHLLMFVLILALLVYLFLRSLMQQAYETMRSSPNVGLGAALRKRRVAPV